MCEEFASIDKIEDEIKTSLRLESIVEVNNERTNDFLKNLALSFIEVRGEYLPKVLT